MAYLNPALVESVIKAQGNKSVTVVFDKKNGETTERNGLPKVHARRVGGERGKRQAQTLKDNGMIWFDYANKNRKDGKAGFSFFKNRVRSIKAQGAIIASA